MGNLTATRPSPTFKLPSLALWQWGLGCLLGLSALLVVSALLGGNPDTIHPTLPLSSLLTPSHWLGTDDLGRDLGARLAVGGAISLAVGVGAAIVSVGVGGAIGILAARCGGWVDNLCLRVMDVLYSLPGLMLVVLMTVFLGRGILSLVVAIAIFSWPDAARVIRASLIQLQQEEFMTAYTAMGGSLWRWIVFYVWPNLAGVILLAATITIPRAILTESTLSFIGLGVEPPMSSWGTLASDGWQLVRVAPNLMILPTICILVAMIGFNCLGDDLAQRFDRQSDPSSHNQ